MLHAWSSARYVFPLPPGHRFPVEKYERLRRRVLDAGVVAVEHLHEPERVMLDDLLRVHTAEYVERFGTGTLDPAAMRRIGLPWSPELVERSWRATGGTAEAAAFALDHGVAMNLAGGTHHAFPDHGEGFCVFNDAAVAIRALQARGRIARAAIVDLDVHQGNGTHAVFAHDPSVFTFSMHGGRNYPFHKVPGSLDVELDDGTGDDVYLDRLQAALPAALSRARPDLVVYLAGADVHEGDRLGRLRLTAAGIARRDVLVLEQCREVGIPVVVTIAGGYGRDLDATVSLHAQTARIAARFA
ncbi:MAG: histone deacetylase [Gemmatimonadota bacterium]|nr:histone deacetylase [Gemmatimonadota bacterium]